MSICLYIDAYTTEDLVFNWRKDAVPVEKNEDIRLPEYDLIGVSNIVCSQNINSTGQPNSRLAACIYQLLIPVPSSNVGQGSQCHPVGLSHYVGPSAIPRKFPAILGTEVLIPVSLPLLPAPILRSLYVTVNLWNQGFREITNKCVK